MVKQRKQRWPEKHSVRPGDCEDPENSEKSESDEECQPTTSSNLEVVRQPLRCNNIAKD